MARGAVDEKISGLDQQLKVLYDFKKKQTHRYREQTSGYQWGEGRGKGQ